MKKKNHQLNLENEDAAPWDGICCEQCWTATGEKCECRCGGAHHGKGSGKSQEESALKKYYPSAQRYRKFITDPVCGSNARHPHDVDLSSEIIWGYPHSDGWEIEKTDKLQWLYISCPVCGHDWSLWKLGVSRTATIKGDQ